MEFKTLAEMTTALEPGVTFDRGLTVRESPRPDPAHIDRLAWTAVFAGDAGLREAARYVIRELARENGAWVASILPLYEARGRGECSGFTVPAMNIRGMTYDVARAAMRAAQARSVGALIFEIARSEVGYTEQRPAEYAAAILAAALRENWHGPVFIQGDHYQVNAKKFAADPDSEKTAILSLIEESIPAGFLNIDIDTSTLVDLSKSTISEQQRLNYELGALFTETIRRIEPREAPVSVGGEIGEVGGKNSTPEELRGYMQGYNAEVERLGGLRGISKVSIQSGTTHGGVPLPDGTIAEAKIDFDVLRDLSRIAREEFGLSGAVQHGASTLPEQAFGHFPSSETSEIHLATGFQNLIYDHDAFPADLREEIRVHVTSAHTNERNPEQTDEQFVYKTRKKAFGPFKRRMWDLPAASKEPIMRDLENRFGFLYEKLAVGETADLVSKLVPRVDVSATPPSTLTAGAK